MFAFWILLIVGLVLLATYAARGSARSFRGGTAERPLEILKRRYARGEITREQFDEMKRVLEE